MADYLPPAAPAAQPPITAALIVYALFAIAAIGAVYGVLAALAFARASSIVRRAPSPFSATIAEFEKDRSAFSGERPPAP